MIDERPLFIPLKREYFDAFANGTKTFELRPWGARWNERTVRIGRRVVLSLGYGKSRRLTGTVTKLEKDWAPKLQPSWVAVYGAKHSVAAVIHIALGK